MRSVTKGQLIAEMDKSLFNAQVDQYKANLELAKATLTYQKSTLTVSPIFLIPVRSVKRTMKPPRIST